LRIAKIALGVGLAAAALLGGAAQASAQPVSASDTYRVTSWHAVNVRQCPGTTCAIDPVFTFPAGATRFGLCWKHGQSITDFGITNDIWVRISLEDGLARYVSAVYLVGDERGNLPVEAVCTT
jgi:hypothetical protein